MVRLSRSTGPARRIVSVQGRPHTPPPLSDSPPSPFISASRNKQETMVQPLL